MIVLAGIQTLTPSDATHTVVGIDVNAIDGTCNLGVQAFLIDATLPSMNAAVKAAIVVFWNSNLLPGSPITGADIMLSGIFDT